MISATDLIRIKRDGHELPPDAIVQFVNAAATGSWPQYQLSALLMAIFWRGMTPEETAHLTRAMADSGRRLRFPGQDATWVDKHSTGGVGDSTSLILAPVAAACGLTVPMMSGRGLGHTGGTLDKLEAIPGYSTQLRDDQIEPILRGVGFAMFGQSQDVAPADRTLYALRDVTATVECLPLLTSSILSKKLAEGISGLVLDVKYGGGAFMKDRAAAIELGQSLVRVARLNGLKCEALLTPMQQPLGANIGNRLEVVESIEILQGKRPGRLRDLSLALAAEMLVIAGAAANFDAALKQAEGALTSGRALEKWRASVAAQGGDPAVIDAVEKMPIAPHVKLYPAKKSGFVSRMDAYELGVASMQLGAGRETASAKVDHAVGIELLVEHGAEVAAGQPLLRIHYRHDEKLATAMKSIDSAVAVDETPLQNTFPLFERLPS